MCTEVSHVIPSGKIYPDIDPSVDGGAELRSIKPETTQQAWSRPVESDAATTAGRSDLVASCDSSYPPTVISMPPTPTLSRRPSYASYSLEGMPPDTEAAGGFISFPQPAPYDSHNLPWKGPVKFPEPKPIFCTPSTRRGPSSSVTSLSSFPPTLFDEAHDATTCSTPSIPERLLSHPPTVHRHTRPSSPFSLEPFPQVPSPYTFPDVCSTSDAHAGHLGDREDLLNPAVTLNSPLSTHFNFVPPTPPADSSFGKHETTQTIVTASALLSRGRTASADCVSTPPTPFSDISADIASASITSEGRRAPRRPLPATPYRPHSSESSEYEQDLFRTRSRTPSSSSYRPIVQRLPPLPAATHLGSADRHADQHPYLPSESPSHAAGINQLPDSGLERRNGEAPGRISASSQVSAYNDSVTLPDGPVTVLPASGTSRFATRLHMIER